MDDLEHSKRDTAKWVRRILPVVILALGIGGTIALVKSRKKPKRKHEIKKSMLVEVLKARQEQRKVQVTSNGTIQPRQEAALAPEVSGKVRWINASLVVGGFMKAGERMLVIEPADYKLFVDKARSAVALAAKNLALAQSSARVARSEWKLHGGAGAKGRPNPLTLYEPQLKAAQAAMASAQADLSQAKLNLRRTVVTAPFNLRVRKKRVDKGQYVRVGQELATVYGTDVAEVIVPLPVSELRWLKIPRRVRGKKQLEGPPVAVRLKVGTTAHERQGVLVRSVGEVDPTGRMSKVVVAIDDPYNLKRGAKADGAQSAVDFEIGAFVEVALQGRSLARVIPIPVEALHAGPVVWVIDGKGALRIRKVTTARVTETEALILSGIEPGQRVILSHVAGAVDGMALRVAGEAAAKGSKGKGKGRGKGKGKGSVNAKGAKSKPWARRGESQAEGGQQR